MAGSSVQHARVNVGAGSSREGFEQIVYKLRLQIANTQSADLGINYRRGASSEIHRGQTERFVHWHDKITGAQNAAAIAQSTIKNLTQRDPNILNRVMLINIQVALRRQFQIEASMSSKELHHVVEETDACGDLILSVTLDREGDLDLRFRGLAMEGRFPHICTSCRSLNLSTTSRRAAIRARVCSLDPTVSRTHPSHPGSELRSRTRMPRSRRAWTNSACFSPMRTSTKFARLGQYCSPIWPSSCSKTARFKRTSAA